MITESDFIAATGYMPENDDLERCNCDKAGEVMHMSCGWNHERNQPVFFGNQVVPRGPVFLVDVIPE